eukprot:scaffold2021_cov176-Amphora_coffeaeformis.AAC.3
MMFKSSRTLRLVALTLIMLLTTNSLPTYAFQGPKPAVRQVKALQVLPHYECATAAVMAGLGDVLAQVQAQKTTNPSEKFVLDKKRTFQFMLKGFGEGFLWTVWYRSAEKWSFGITRSIIGGMAASHFLKTLVGTVVSLLLDLTLACPFIYGLWDIPFPALLKGTPWRKLPKLIHEKLGEMLLASVKVWTPVNILIYNVPVQYRVYIMSCADVFWQMIVSSITTGPTDPNAAVPQNSPEKPAEKPAAQPA